MVLGSGILVARAVGPSAAAAAAGASTASAAVTDHLSHRQRHGGGDEDA